MRPVKQRRLGPIERVDQGGERAVGEALPDVPERSRHGDVHLHDLALAIDDQDQLGKEVANGSPQPRITPQSPPLSMPGQLAVSCGLGRFDISGRGPKGELQREALLLCGALHVS